MWFRWRSVDFGVVGVGRGGGGEVVGKEEEGESCFCWVSMGCLVLRLLLLVFLLLVFC